MMRGNWRVLDKPIFPLEEMCDFSDEIFYHGTSDKWQMTVLKPPLLTGVIRERDRNEFQNKVFFTNRLDVAQNYARKAVERFGGHPIVYEVSPEGEVWNVRDYEFVADRAKIETVVWNG